MLVPFERIKNFIVAAAEKTGVCEEEAEILADSLIVTDMRGMRTHGTIRFPVYAKNLSMGKTNPKPKITTEHKTPTTLTLNGDNGLGSVVMTRAMDEGIKIAEQYGMAVVGVRNCNHIGACGYYADTAARRGYFTMVMTEAAPYVAPFGAADAYFGTNPICIAMPWEGGFPVVADMATSVVARGKITAAQRRGKDIPLGWALDKEGNPTTDANAAAEGVLLPFGAHKGSALSMMVSYTCGVLTGAAFGFDLASGANLNRTKNSDIGAIIILIRSDSFLPKDAVNERMNAFCGDIKNLRVAPGFKEIFLPGEIEDRAYRASLETGGLEIDDKLMGELRDLAEQLGVPAL